MKYDKVTIRITVRVGCPVRNARVSKMRDCAIGLGETSFLLRAAMMATRADLALEFRVDRRKRRNREALIEAADGS